VLLVGLLVAAALAWHRQVPTEHGVALVWESAMPWVWVLVVVLALAALVRHSLLSLVGVLVPALVWGVMFVPQLLGGDQPPAEPRPGDQSSQSGRASGSEFVVATQNLSVGNASPTQAAEALVQTDADVVAVEELSGVDGQRAAAVLSNHYRYHTRATTVGLWSKYPMDGVQQLSLGMSWNRALRATVRTSHGGVAVYAVHLPSVRPGEQDARDLAIRRLSGLVADDGHRRIVLAGDLNCTTSDRHFDDLNGQLTDSRTAVGGGFGFTWPARFPLVRPDHVLSKGFTTEDDTVLSANGSDHRGLLVRLALR
jgi:vancomycin resistance protein VanJ